MFIDRRLIAHFDWGLFFLAFVIPIVGLVVLYSAGYDPDSTRQAFSWAPFIIKSQAFYKQIYFILGGLVVMLIGLSIPSQTLFRYAYLIYGLCLALLVLVLFFGIVSHGSQRWFVFGGMHFQPAEIMKLALILGLARFLYRSPPKVESYRVLELIKPFIMVGLPMGLIIMQPDLGTALAVGAIGFCMILFMGIRMKSLAIMFIVAVIALIPAWYQLHDYQQRRIKVLLNPEQDPQGDGWHITQSKIAVGSGELLGKGFLKGSQTQLEFLPERTTDFVFCVLAEEYGFAGSFFVLFLYTLFIYRLLRVAFRSKDLFSILVSFGITVMIFFHAIVNIGMVVGVLPIVGLPLPLFSYGGSSMISTMFAIGIVLGISMRRLVFVS